MTFAPATDPTGYIDAFRPRDEAWRLTDLRPVSAHSYDPLDGDDDAPAERIADRLSKEPAGTIILWNGRVASGAAAAPSGTRLTTGAAVPADDLEDGLGERNRRFARDGVMLEVPAGIAVAAPLRILHIGDADGRSVHTRTIVRLGEGACASLLETFESGAGSLTNHRLSIELAPGATLAHAQIQDEHGEALHFLRQTTRIAADASYTGFVLALGARLSRHEAGLDLVGPRAHGAISGAYLLRDRQQATLATTIHHAAPDGTSRQLFKGMVDDRGHGVFQGKVKVARAGQRTDAHQLSKAMLLSERARVDAKPELEIYADDVKCSHGATVGDLDQAALFYLMARGIDPATARAMLIEAFASDALEQVADPAIRATLHDHVTAWLARGRAA